MDPHLHEYLNDRITSDGLRKLRRNVDSMGDDELAEQMRADWEEFNNRPSIDAPVVMQAPGIPIWRRIMRYAAMLAIVLLAGLSLYLYYGNRRLEAQDITVMTGGGERASVQLPDGTMVALNSNSMLTYSASGFASSERSVAFEGEGFFDVIKDKKRPFTVNADRLTVTVRGTSFNLCSRADADEATLYLEEGAVELYSLSTGESVSVEPGDLAVLNYATGRFSLSSDHDGTSRTAWRAGDLIYINEPLISVIKSLERNFNYKIVLDDASFGDVPFTGTLSGTNIYDAVKILEITFGLRCSGSNGNLRLTSTQ